MTTSSTTSGQPAQSESARDAALEQAAAAYAAARERLTLAGAA